MRYIDIDPSYTWKAAKNFWMRHCTQPYPKDVKELYRGPPVEFLKETSPFRTWIKPPEEHLVRRVWFWESNLIIDRR